MPFAFAQSRRGTIKAPNGKLAFPRNLNPSGSQIGSDISAYVILQPNGDGIYGSTTAGTQGNCDWFSPLTTNAGEKYEVAVLLNDVLGTNKTFTPEPSTWVSLDAADTTITYRNQSVGGVGIQAARLVFRLKGTTEVLYSAPITFTANNDGS